MLSVFLGRADLGREDDESWIRIQAKSNASRGFPKLDQFKSEVKMKSMCTLPPRQGMKDPTRTIELRPSPNRWENN